jgi:pilus assembly protein Flp/PilA
MLNQILAIANLRKQRGLTTVEYAIAGGLVVAGVITIFLAMGGSVASLLTTINSALTTATK